MGRSGLKLLPLVVLLILLPSALSRPMEKRRVVLRVLHGFGTGFVNSPDNEHLSRIFQSSLVAPQQPAIKRFRFLR